MYVNAQWVYFNTPLRSRSALNRAVKAGRFPEHEGYWGGRRWWLRSKVEAAVRRGLAERPNFGGVVAEVEVRS